MGAVILVLVTWVAAGQPDAQVFVAKDMHECSAMAQSFVLAEEVMNASNPYTMREHYSVSCERKNGNDVRSM